MESSAIEREITLEPDKVLEIVKAELDFYRRRQITVYYFALTAQVLVVTGRYAIPNVNAVVAVIVYSFFFVGIALATALIGMAYTKRIRHIRNFRDTVLKRAGYGEHALPLYGDIPKLPSPSTMYALVVALLSLVGLLLSISNAAGAFITWVTGG